MSPPDPTPGPPARPSAARRAAARLRAAWPYWPLLPAVVLAALVVYPVRARDPGADPGAELDAVRVGRLVAALTEDGERLARLVVAKIRPLLAWARADHHEAPPAREMRRYFVELLAANEAVAVIGFGTPAGDYLAVDRLGPDGAFRLVVRNARTDDQLHIYALSPAGEAVGAERNAGRYDATTRPWYSAAAARADGDGEWGEPFVYATEPVLAVNYGVPVHHDGHLAGVLTVSVSMDHVGRLLRQAAPGGAAYLQETAGGNLLAASAGGDPFYVTGSQTTRYQPHQSPDALVKRAAAALDAPGGAGAFADDAGRRFAAVVAPHRWGRWKWDLVVVRPAPVRPPPPTAWALAAGVLALAGLAVARGRLVAGYRRRWEPVRDTAAVGAIVWDRDFRVVEWNPGAAAVFGYPRAEMVGNTAAAILPPDEAGRATVAKIWTDLLAAGGPVTSANRNRHKDGRALWCEWWNYPVRGPAGELVEVVSLVRDATAEADLRRAAAATERRLRRAARAKARFLANMSHELRTPILSFATAVENLRARTPPSPARDRTLAAAAAAAAICGRVIDQVLLFARGAKRIEVRPRAFDLPAAVAAVVNLARTRAPAGLTVAAAVDPAVPRAAAGDDGLVQRVLLELVVNAVKYTPRGSVVVRVAPDPGGADRVRFEVTDTGVGIAPADLARLFRPFFRVDDSTIREQEGTGLGLAVVQQVVAALGGTVEVESRPKLGSTFAVVLPLPPAAVPAPEPPAPEPAPHAGTRLLLVEDNPVLGPAAADRYRDRGLAVRLATTARDALAALGAEPFDAAVVDCALPEVDGFELVRQFRTRERKARPPGRAAGAGRLPVVGFSASDEYRARALEAGMDAFVLKQATWDALDAELARHLGGLPPAPAAPPADAAADDRTRREHARIHLASLDAAADRAGVRLVVHHVIVFARMNHLADLEDAAVRARAAVVAGAADADATVADMRRLLADAAATSPPPA